ncbi:hypothetical protein NCLIV_010490 [Neospora caninum Liverpool]|nr:hypothetical protein NCLIV_010490 [Neospora caninum Liverpool]CBZ50580.1 hypothetical protein NCLIV_010490 [Neospora caninum Liverpool]|eukprot:XP_003880613.1 hypothetical protein NCLIV_010490 [Neospora caninum Liverpool]
MPPFWELRALRTLEHRIVNAVLKRLFTFQCVADDIDRTLSSSFPESPFPGESGTLALPEDTFHVEQLKWAACIVSSRSFRVDCAASVALVPLLDLINCGGKGEVAPNAKVTTWDRKGPRHSGDRRSAVSEARALQTAAGDSETARRFETEALREEREERAFEDGVGIVATRDIHAGEEIRISYGEDTDRLLLNYGFFDAAPRVMKTNVFFSATLVRAALAATEVPDLLMLSGFGGLPPRQSAALRALRLIPDPTLPPTAAPRFSPLVDVFAGEPVVEGRLLAAARVLMLDEDTLGSEIDVETAADWERPFSAENERRACEFLVSLLRHEHHRTHSASLEEDSEILATRRMPTGEVAFGKAPFEPLTAPREVALRFRMHRKRILREAIACLLMRHRKIGEDAVKPEA